MLWVAVPHSSPKLISSVGVSLGTLDGFFADYQAIRDV
jgi:hypothetical protein